jgi:hypothetical protein
MINHSKIVLDVVIYHIIVIAVSYLSHLVKFVCAVHIYLTKTNLDFRCCYYCHANFYYLIWLVT